MTRRMVIALLALVGAFIAAYLTLYKTGVLGTIACSVGSCETVQASRWATFLGLPVAAWGLGFYLTLFAVALVGLGERFVDSVPYGWLLAALTGWGFLFSAWLTALEAFWIGAWCAWCVVSALIATTVFVLALADLRALRRDLRATDAVEVQAPVQ